MRRTIGWTDSSPKEAKMGEGIQCVERFSVLLAFLFHVLPEEDEYRHTFVELVQTTYQLVRNHVAESVWVASATAQRVDVDLNVENSIRSATSGASNV